jgi:hypothetical protein
MSDSILNRPLFVGGGQFPEPVKPKPTGPTAPVKFDLSDIYKADMVPFDADGIASLMSAYNVTPESVRKQYEEFAGTPKTAEQFAQEYDALTPTDTTPEENFGFEKNLALIRLGLGLMQPTPGGAIMPALSKAGENFLGDLAAINERKRKAKAARAEQESEEDRARREYILKAMQEQNDMRSANEFEMFMKVLQINTDADEGDLRFKRELAKQNFAYKYDVDMMAMENNAKLLMERFKKTPKVFALKPEGYDQTVKYVTGYLGVDPADGIEKPFIPKQIGDKIEYVPAPLQAVVANFSLNDDGTLKANVKDQITASEKINQGNQALSFVKDIKASVAENRFRIGAPGLVIRTLQNVRSTILDVSDALLGAGVIDQDAYEGAKNKIDQSVFNDLANTYQENNPGRNATDFYSDKNSEEGLIYNEFFNPATVRSNFDPDIAANEIKLNSIYYAIARSRKRTGRLNVDDIRAARDSLTLYTLDFTKASSDQIIAALDTVEMELQGFVDAQTNAYKQANYNEEFLFNYEPTKFSINVELPATGTGNPVETLDPYDNLPEGIQ